MKAPIWKNNVLIVSNDLDLISKFLPIFKVETVVTIAKNSEEAQEALVDIVMDVVIIDEMSLSKQDKESESEEISLFELSQYAKQFAPSVNIISLVNKIKSEGGAFARKCGSILTMSRKNVDLNKILFCIRTFRKRTFRTVVVEDLVVGSEFGNHIYHYLPSSNRYAVFLHEGIPLTQKKLDTLTSGNCHHLYVRELDFKKFLVDTRNGEKLKFTHTKFLSQIRDNLFDIFTDFMDFSMEGKTNVGLEIDDRISELSKSINDKVNEVDDVNWLLDKFKFPRWSAFAHSVNTAILTAIFLRANPEIELDPVECISGTLFHNIGLCSVKQEVLKKNEAEMNEQDREEYFLHLKASIEIFKEKRVPITKTQQRIFKYHHESYDGSAGPKQLIGDVIPMEALIVSICSSFDHIRATRPFRPGPSLKDAFERLERYHASTSLLGVHFDPMLLSRFGELLGVEKIKR